MTQSNKELARSELQALLTRHPGDLEVQKLDQAWYRDIRAEALARAASAPASPTGTPTKARKP